MGAKAKVASDEEKGKKGATKGEGKPKSFTLAEALVRSATDSEADIEAKRAVIAKRSDYDEVVEAYELRTRHIKSIVEFDKVKAKQDERGIEQDGRESRLITLASEVEANKQTEKNTEAELLRATRLKLTGVIANYDTFTKQAGDLSELRKASANRLGQIAESVFGMVIAIGEAMDATAKEYGSRFTRDRYSEMIAKTFFHRFLVSVADKEVADEAVNPQDVVIKQGLVDWLMENREGVLIALGITQAIAPLARDIEVPDDTSQRVALQLIGQKGEFDTTEEEQEEQGETDENE